MVSIERSIAVLAAMIQSPHDLRVGARLISAADVDLLHPTEIEQMARASDGRRREFASGRALLRSLLRRDVAIPLGADRRPMLPRGVSASLAHDDRVAVAVMCVSPTSPFYGLDVEPIAQYPHDMRNVIARPDEEGLDPSLLFCLKESAYKAWSFAGGDVLGHHDVRIELNGRLFTAAVVDSATTIAGFWTVAEGRWLGLASIARR